jgi:hypothetical protein
MEVLEVKNMDYPNLQRRIRRIQAELEECSSANINEFNEFDYERAVNFLKDYIEEKKWVVSRPYLDRPATHPKPIALEPKRVKPKMGNDDINVLWDLLELAEQELLGAQSRDRSSGLTDDDSKRFDAIFGKAVIYLEERVGKKIATDFPETGTMYESGE